MLTTQEVKFPDADAYPKWLWWVALSFGLPFFALIIYLTGNALHAFFGSLSVSAIAVVFITLRQWRTRVTFWIAMILAGGVHYWLVSALPGSDSHFAGIVFTPLVIADILLWQYITVVSIRVLRI